MWAFIYKLSLVLAVFVANSSAVPTAEDNLIDEASCKGFWAERIVAANIADANAAETLVLSQMKLGAAESFGWIKEAIDSLVQEQNEEVKSRASSQPPGQSTRSRSRAREESVTRNTLRPGVQKIGAERGSLVDNSKQIGTSDNPEKSTMSGYQMAFRVGFKSLLRRILGDNTVNADTNSNKVLEVLKTIMALRGPGTSRALGSTARPNFKAIYCGDKHFKSIPQENNPLYNNLKLSLFHDPKAGSFFVSGKKPDSPPCSQSTKTVAYSAPGWNQIEEIKLPLKPQFESIYYCEERWEGAAIRTLSTRAKLMSNTQGWNQQVFKTLVNDGFDALQQVLRFHLTTIHELSHTRSWDTANAGGALEPATIDVKYQGEKSYGWVRCVVLSTNANNADRAQRPCNNADSTAILVVGIHMLKFAIQQDIAAKKPPTVWGFTGKGYLESQLYDPKMSLDQNIKALEAMMEKKDKKRITSTPSPKGLGLQPGLGPGVVGRGSKLFDNINQPGGRSTTPVISSESSSDEEMPDAEMKIPVRKPRGRSPSPVRGRSSGPR